jgi:hypothetical protein
MIGLMDSFVEKKQDQINLREFMRRFDSVPRLQVPMLEALLNDFKPLHSSFSFKRRGLKTDRHLMHLARRCVPSGSQGLAAVELSHRGDQRKFAFDCRTVLL